MTDPASPLALFEGYGIEIEYMIVDSETLNVSPMADQVLRELAGEITNEAECGACCWSNELVLHVIELKTNGPAADINKVASEFSHQIGAVNEILAKQGACLMPGGMHPWMNPSTETHLWPHENNPIYEAYNRIFNCSGHGWANLQSMHLNLPFANEREFASLHAAIRLILPILPALTASSPIMDGAPTGLMDNRLEVYRGNQTAIPSIGGLVIPEPVSSYAEYQSLILEPMYRDISRYEGSDILCDEWLNSRGAIARFERNAIEIRVMDTQENPRADLAIAQSAVAALKTLIACQEGDAARQNKIATEALHAIFLKVIRSGDKAVIEDCQYLDLLGVEHHGPLNAGEVWLKLLEASSPGLADSVEMGTILSEGCLARRIIKSLPVGFDADMLYANYNTLCDCLADGILYHSPSSPRAA